MATRTAKGRRTTAKPPKRKRASRSTYDEAAGVKRPEAMPMVNMPMRGPMRPGMM